MTTRVYPAEKHVFGERMYSKEHGVSIPDAREIVNRHVVGWTVVRGKGKGSWCHWETQTLSLGQRAGLPVVLHELAHALTPKDRGHGAPFQTAYVRLVEQEMSPWWARRLRAAFRRERTRGYRRVMRETA